MGLPITIHVVGKSKSKEKAIEDIFKYFREVDAKFSTYKKDSEISQFNRGEILVKNLSPEIKLVLRLCEQTKFETNGYFDIKKENGQLDPPGLVKGWAIWQASKLLKKKSVDNFIIEAGGDIQTEGFNEKNNFWSIGIRNPFRHFENVKIIKLSGEGVATSGTYERGQHIYNPKNPKSRLVEIVSLTVVGPNIYEADRFATAAFAMQEKGIKFIETIPGLEGYAISWKGIATMTSGFQKYVKFS